MEEGTGEWITVTRMHSSDFTRIEKELYFYLLHFKDSYCTETNDQLAANLGVSRRSISRSLKLLNKKILAVAVFENNNSSKRRIYVTDER